MSTQIQEKWGKTSYNENMPRYENAVMSTIGKKFWIKQKICAHNSFSKDLKIKDVKKIIENKTEIKEENQIFHVYCQFSG